MKKLMFLAAIASFAFVACSKDDVAGRPTISADMTTSFAKMSVSMPSINGTRADWGTAFDAGTTEESAVSSISLVLYYDGMVVGTGTTADYAFETGSSDISHTDDIVFKLSLNEGAPKPNQVVAFINTDGAAFDLSNLASSANKIAIEDATALTGEDGESFPMTNAGYYNGSTYTIAAELKDAYIFADASAAANATDEQIAAKIYVERLAAKVTVKNTATETSPKDINITDVAGEPVTIDFNATTWGMTGTAKDMYLLKKDFTYDSTNDSWMNAAYRSYWAEGTNWDVKYADGGYLTKVDDDLKTSTEILNYLSFNEIDKTMGTADGNNDVEYVPEHTYPYETLAKEPLFNPVVPSTSAIVIGNYTIESDNSEWFEDDNEDSAYDFYLLYTGADSEGHSNYTIYNKSQLIAYLLNRNGIDEVATEESAEEGISTDVKDDDTDFTEYFDIKKNEEDGLYYIIAKDGADTLYTGEEFDEPIAAEDLEKGTSAMHYNHGLAYFYVPITHNEAKEDKNGYYGIVRNHSYVMNIIAIPGLGAPLSEDKTDGDGADEPIVPNPDDLKDAYIKATINILSWHDLEHDVTLK